MSIWLRMKLGFGVVLFVVWPIGRRQGSGIMWRHILNPLSCALIAHKFASQGILSESIYGDCMEQPIDSPSHELTFAGLISLEIYMSKVKDDSGTVICFSCNYCSKTMSRKDHMKNHIQTHFPQQEVGCGICGIMCKNIPSLKVHMSRKHSQGLHGTNN